MCWAIRAPICNQRNRFLCILATQRINDVINQFLIRLRRKSIAVGCGSDDGGGSNNVYSSCIAIVMAYCRRSTAELHNNNSVYSYEIHWAKQRYQHTKTSAKTPRFKCTNVGIPQNIVYFCTKRTWSRKYAPNVLRFCMSYRNLFWLIIFSFG